ncbi:MAG: methylated-DNA--[protein]-cysteine S-methyltransferase [Pseudomonadota bacterium]
MRYAVSESPVGDLIFIGDDNGLQFLEFYDSYDRYTIGDWDECADFFADVNEQLHEYFDGQRESFDLKLNPQGTEFQRSVWRALCEIPYGETRSYGEIANVIGNPKSVRAVGAANGRNPIAIVQPCHRVIGSDGSLTGFGGGLPRKQFLLNLEGARQGELPL